MNSIAPSDLRRERWKLTARVVRLLETPMLILSGLWTVLLVVEFTRGLSPWLQTLNDVIWIMFIAQFAIEFMAAPSKRVYVRKRWITAVSLALPALRLVRLVRIARIARLGRAARGIRLARLLASINRGMRTLAIGFRRRGIGYLILLTLTVLFTGAAGMYRFELDVPGGPPRTRFIGSLRLARRSTTMRIAMLWARCWTALATSGPSWWPVPSRRAGRASIDVSDVSGSDSEEEED